MNLRNTLKVAFRSLYRNALRSFLTMLGVIIGVSCVIAMMSVGQGARDSVQKSIASLGTNVIMLFSQASRRGGVSMEAGTGKPFTEEDVAALQKLDEVRYVSPNVRSMEQVVFGQQNWRTGVLGAYPEYFLIREFQIDKGVFFTPADDRSAAKVCVIGKTVSDTLFGEGVNPVGQIIRIRKFPFKVLGLLASKGQNASGQDQDDVIIAPFKTVQRKLEDSRYIRMIIISAKSAEVIPAAAEKIRQLLRERHRLPDTEDDDFTVRTQTEIADTYGAITRTLSILLASIASISLLVGGIGIMNIMLVSVTERTREIGIRMAVGARGKDVLLQFLVEALMLSFSGGIIGILLGVGASKTLSKSFGWAVTVTPQSIFLSFFFAAAIGVFFGWYPAKKAANMNPIEALRYE